MTPTYPGFVEYTEPPSSISTTPCPDKFNTCLNPLYAYDHQDECGLVTVDHIEIAPKDQILAVGRGGCIYVLAVFTDGRTAYITNESLVSIGDATKASYIGGGVVFGLTAGATSLFATWRGRTAIGSLIIEENVCTDSRPKDVVVIVNYGELTVYRQVPIREGSWLGGRRLPYERLPGETLDMGSSGSMIGSMVAGMDLMWTGYENDWWLGSAAATMVDSIHTGTDRIWNGSKWINTWDRTNLFPTTYPTGGQSILAGLAVALTGRPGSRKVIIFASTGAEVSCGNPDTQILGAADLCRASDVELFIVTPLRTSDGNYFAPCDMPRLALDVLAQAVTGPCYLIQSDGFDLWGSSATYAGPRNPWLDTCTDTVCSSGSGVGLQLL